MYIEFSKHFAQNINNLPEVTVLEILDRARISACEGFHVVSCESSQTVQLIQNFAKERSKLLFSFFVEMYDRVRELNQIKNEVEIYASISSEIDTSLLLAPKGKIQIGLDLAVSLEFWKGLSFLVENSHDAMLYKWISLYEKDKISELKKIDIYFNIVNGGGGTTHKEMLRINCGNRLVLCFLDSDKKYPKQETCGATASEFNEDDISLISSYYVIKAQELENLFFTYEFTTGIKTKRTGLKMVNDMVSAAERNTSDFRLFFDVKNGYLKKDALKIPYIKKALSVKSYCDFQKNECVRCEKCCERVIGGYGSEYLDLIEEKYSKSKRLDKKSFYKDVKSLNQYQKREWKCVGNKLFSWACSYTYKSRGM